jgi:hypothetical protein
MSVHRGPASLRSRCTWGGNPVAATPIHHLQFVSYEHNELENQVKVAVKRHKNSLRRHWNMSSNVFLNLLLVHEQIVTKTRTDLCIFLLSLSLTSYIHVYGAPSKVRNLTLYVYGRDFLLGILLLEPCISLIYAWKTNKYTNYSFNLLIMFGGFYMFRHYIAIIRQRS